MKNTTKDDSLLISGIDASTINHRLDFYSRENIPDSQFDLSDSLEEGPIRVQESFSISEIYREVGKENLYNEGVSKADETNDFFKLLEDNTGLNSKQKAYSKLDESSIVGENCKVLIENTDKVANDLIKKQQKKYYKAFVVLQAHFVSAKEASERKIGLLNSQIKEASLMIKENKEFYNRIECEIEQRIEGIKEEVMGKFRNEVERLMQKFQNRENDLRKVTKNKIVNMRKEIDENSEIVFRSFDGSKAKNSEDLLRKNCEMRLKLALMQAEAQSMRE